MLKNILLEIEYDGSGYFGWQVQKSSKFKVQSSAIRTVQGEIEKALGRLFCREVRIHSAGRTDRGVHAKQQYANFKIETKIPLANIKTALNSFLAADIEIKKIKEVPLDFHSRFCASSKVYRYIIFNRREPCVFERNFAWHIPDKIDLTKIKRSISKLLGKKDFSCFAKQPQTYKTCVRNIMAIALRERSGFLYFDLEADGFMRNMVRNIISFLLLVGTNKIPLRDVSGIIKGKIHYINKPAPAAGLYLLRVNYDKK